MAARFAAILGLSAGLAAAPFLDPGLGARAVAFGAAAASLSVLARRLGASTAPLFELALLVAACGVAGAGLGSLRVAAIDAGALRLAPGAEATVDGFVTAVPRRASGEAAVRIDTAAGRLLVRAPEPTPQLGIGTGVRATGTVRAPAAAEVDYLARQGVARVLEAESIEVSGRRRGGLVGALDRVREAAERALASGAPPTAAALLRGFVLGEDDRIPAPVAEDFRRSGLAHLLAVSGQNVVLLSILAGAILSLAGVSLRARLVAIAALIGAYVIVTGAGPSIQRAGAMGVAGVAAALLSRPRSRWYALLLATASTLIVNPRATGDVGWQLSFAAVVGILVAAEPLARALGGARPTRLRRVTAEAAAMTLSATLATAPLISLHFGSVSIASIPANLVAVAAEAPVMWLGMIAAALGQLPGAPAEPIAWLAGLLAGYLAQVAHWFGSPRWAQVDAALGGPVDLVAAYAALSGTLVIGLRAVRRRAGLRFARRRRRVLVALAAVIVCLAAVWAIRSGRSAPPPDRPELRVTLLDVGQGDAILLEPGDGEPILVDAGPHGSGVDETLRDRGADRLAAAVITHPDADHAGGAPAVLAGVDVGTLVTARSSSRLRAAAQGAGVRAVHLAAGGLLRSGSLVIRALWPPAAMLREGGRPAEPNAVSLVLLVRWRGFRMLLTGDAEAADAAVHPGDVDVLKVAHHGSEDPGLRGLLAEARPELAVISVGAENPYGHPAPTTLALLSRTATQILRTDLDGEVTIRVANGRWSASGS